MKIPAPIIYENMNRLVAQDEERPCDLHVYLPDKTKYPYVLYRVYDPLDEDFRIHKTASSSLIDFEFVSKYQGPKQAYEIANWVLTQMVRTRKEWQGVKVSEMTRRSSDMFFDDERTDVTLVVVTATVEISLEYETNN